MHARIINLNLKPGAKGAAYQGVRAAAREMEEVTGFRQLMLVETGERAALAIAVFETEAAAESSAGAIQALYERIGDCLALPPTRKLGRVPVYAFPPNPVTPGKIEL